MFRAAALPRPGARDQRQPRSGLRRVRPGARAVRRRRRPGHRRPGLEVEVDGRGRRRACRLDEPHLVVQVDARGVRRARRPARGLAARAAPTAIPHGRGLGSSAAAIVAGVVAGRALLVGGGDALLDDDALLRWPPSSRATRQRRGCLSAGSRSPGPTDGRAPAPCRLRCAPGVVPVAFVPGRRVVDRAARAAAAGDGPARRRRANAGRAALLVDALTAGPDLLLPATEDRLHQEYRAPAMPRDARRWWPSCAPPASRPWCRGAGPDRAGAARRATADRGRRVSRGAAGARPPPGVDVAGAGVARRGRRAGSDDLTRDGRSAHGRSIDRPRQGSGRPSAVLPWCEHRAASRSPGAPRMIWFERVPLGPGSRCRCDSSSRPCPVRRLAGLVPRCAVRALPGQDQHSTRPAMDPVPLEGRNPVTETTQTHLVCMQRPTSGDASSRHRQPAALRCPSSRPAADLGCPAPARCARATWSTPSGRQTGGSTPPGQLPAKSRLRPAPARPRSAQRRRGHRPTRPGSTRLGQPRSTAVPSRDGSSVPPTPRRTSDAAAATPTTAPAANRRCGTAATASRGRERPATDDGPPPRASSAASAQRTARATAAQNRQGGNRQQPPGQPEPPAGPDSQGGQQGDRQGQPAGQGNRRTARAATSDERRRTTGRRRPSPRRRNRDRDRNAAAATGRRRSASTSAEPEINEDDVLVPVAGILDILDNYAFVRTTGYLPGPERRLRLARPGPQERPAQGRRRHRRGRQPREGEQRPREVQRAGPARHRQRHRPRGGQGPRRSSPSSRRSTRRSGCAWRPSRAT